MRILIGKSAKEITGTRPEIYVPLADMRRVLLDKQLGIALPNKTIENFRNKPIVNPQNGC